LIVIAFRATRKSYMPTGELATKRIDPKKNANELV